MRKAIIKTLTGEYTLDDQLHHWCFVSIAERVSLFYEEGVLSKWPSSIRIGESMIIPVVRNPGTQQEHEGSVMTTAVIHIQVIQ